MSPPNSRFDQFLTGADTLTEQEVRGLQSFIDEGCAACHAGVNMGGQEYHPFGLVERPGAAVLLEATVADIAAFLRTLTGEIPQVVHPMLPP